MSTTKGRIDRTGLVRFHDAKLSVWEEGLCGARQAGGFDAAEQWERQFKRDVFARIVQTLRRLGWAVGPGVHIWTGNNARHCRKGDLQADLRVSGRVIELEFFQAIYTPKRPDNDGRYEFDKEGIMPYLLRIEMERTRQRIRDYLLNVFTGYTFKPKRNWNGRGMTAMEQIQAHYAESCHFKGDLSNYTISAYNNKSADEGVITHGARVWFADGKGRILTGTAYYNINNMWWVSCGRYGLSNKASFEIFTKCPNNLRTKRNGAERRRRLEHEIAVSVKAMQFERAAVLRDILFPGTPELFVVWHTEHGLYHRANFCGYTSDMADAGRFTAEEVRGWNAAPNQVRPVVASAKKAA